MQIAGFGATGGTAGSAPGSGRAAMKWYADQPRRRARQQVGDVAVLVSILLFLRLGKLVYDTVQSLQGAVAAVEQAGGGLADGLSAAARVAGNAPVIGGGLRAPFDSAANAARSLGAAGVAEQEAVHRLALVLGLTIGLLPVVFLIWRWLPRRVRYAREAGAALWLRGDLELLALRAATFTPLHTLAQLGPDPVARWRRGEPGAAEALAELELSRLGLQGPVHRQDQIA
jgi:hypothetical protein